MQMGHRLPRFGAVVGHDAEAFHAQFPGNLRQHFKNMRHQAAVLLCYGAGAGIWVFGITRTCTGALGSIS